MAADDNVKMTCGPSMLVFRVTAIATVVFLSSESLHSQPVSIGSSSVEWWAAHSPLIVRAVVEDFAPIEPVGQNRRHQSISVRVLETIKGPHHDRLQFADWATFTPDELSKWKQDQQELLLFLEPWARSGHFDRRAGGYAYARFSYAAKMSAVLTTDNVRLRGISLPPRTADLTVVNTPSQLLAAIKAYLAKSQSERPMRSVGIELPPEMRGGFYRVSFGFPADANPAHPASATLAPVADYETLKTRFAAPPPAEAKPPYRRDRGGYIGVYAMELMAADSDAIVRGVIDDWFFITASEDSTGPHYGVRVRVLEKLKGSVPEYVSAYVTDARNLEDLRRTRQELILFLRDPRFAVPADMPGYRPGLDSENPVFAFGHQTRATLWDDSVIVLNDRDAEALLADLSWRRHPGEILDRLRANLTKKSDSVGGIVPPVFSVHPPASTIAGSSIAGNQHAVVYLPVDANLEANARQWAASDNKDLRWLAARALIYFKSDANAALLRTMLDDTATWTREKCSI